MKAIKELIDYFISRGTFTCEEIRRMIDLGYLKPEKEEDDSDTRDDIVRDTFQPEPIIDEDLQIEAELSRKRIRAGSKLQRKNILKVSELNHFLGKAIQDWKPELIGLLRLLSILNGQESNFRSLSLIKLDEISVKSLLIQNLRSDPDFIVSLWNSISFDGYLDMFPERSGIGVKIYSMICRGENILNQTHYRFCLKYYYIKLFQCIVLAQRLLLKTFMVLFHEEPDLVLAFLRKSEKKEIIASFLLYDIVSHNLLKFNRVSLFISEKPLRQKGCREADASASNNLVSWGRDCWVARWNLADSSQEHIDYVNSTPELFINSDGSLVAFYLKPYEHGTNKEVSKIFVFRKKYQKSDEWQKWKELIIYEGNPFRLRFHPDGKRLLMVRSKGESALWNLPKGRSREFRDKKFEKLANIEFSPDGNTVFLAGLNYDKSCGPLSGKTGKQASRDIFSYSFPEFKLVSTLPSRMLVRGLSVSPDGNFLAFFSNSTKVMVWDLIGKELFKLSGHTGLVKSVAFGCHKNILASAGMDGTICIWDVSSRNCIRTIDLKIFDKPSLLPKVPVRSIKVALLRDDLIYLDNSRGLFIFKINISQITSFSCNNRYIKKWSAYFGEYWLNRIALERKVLFNALVMDEGKNSESYKLLIENEINSLICDKTIKNE